MTNLQNKILLIFIYSAILLLFLSNCFRPFFWDTVQLASQHANHFFSTQFSSILLPDHIDSGHIPGFGLYLASIWKIFERSLLVSHLAMLPFVMGILLQTYRLLQIIIPEKFTALALLLVILDPTLLSQMILVSPDIPLIFFFLLGINSVLRNERAFITLSILSLFLISMRGMMVSVCILSLDLYHNINFKDHLKNVMTKLAKRSFIYLPALVLFISYYSIHFFVKGWIGFHSESPWAPSFEYVGFSGILYNIGILGWRLLDFGRIGIWVIFLFLLLKFNKRIFDRKLSKTLFLFNIFTLSFLAFFMLWANNLIAHRYLLPVYLLFSIFVITLLFTQDVNQKIRNFILTIWLLFLMSGHFWIYPPKISQGWDSTLAHLPYYQLRKNAIEYLDREKIDFTLVSSFFPNRAHIDDMDLNGDLRQFAKFDGQRQYVFYSNVYNLKDQAYDDLIQNYAVIKQFNSCRIFVQILKKKK